MFRSYFIIILIFSVCVSCSKRDKYILPILDLAELCLDQSPDSSLTLLNTIKLNTIESEHNRARYALLKSIALDKNYIDVSDDSLTSIAISYYKKNGKSNERLKAFLYSGRVFENSKEYEKAMDCYLSAEEFVSDCDDNIIIGRLYNSKSVLYNTIFDTESAIEQAHLASMFFLRGGDTVRYLNNLNNLALIMDNTSSYDSIDVYNNHIEKYWYKLTPAQKKVYYSIKLNRIPKTDTVAVISMINMYLSSSTNDKYVNWLSVADAYFSVGYISESLIAINKHKLSGGITDATYYMILSNIYGKIGEYDKAYHYLIKRNEALHGRYYRATKSDTRFLEERYASKIRDVKQKHMIVFLVLGFIIIVMALIILKNHYKTLLLKDKIKVQLLEDEAKLRQQEIKRLAAEKENYELKCREAINEQEKLKKILESNKSNKQLDPEILLLVKQRLVILDKFIAANISSAFSKEALKELNQLMQDRSSFLESTRMSYKILHPQFIKHLYSKGLTDREVACCCLYCIGLNGSEISNYLEMKSFYNISKVIRSKLLVDRSMNIDTYLHKLLFQLD